jgi:hypothetical protein
VRRAFAALALAAFVAFAPGAALAQVPTIRHDAAFAVERLTPSPGPGVFVQVEDGDVAEAGAWSAAATLSFASRPLVVRHIQTGAVLSEPVRTHTQLDLGAAIGVGHAAQVALALPVVLYQSGDRLRGLDLPEPDGSRALAAAALGDLRLSGKLSLVTPEGGLGQAWGAAATLTLPTGDETQFAGEASTVVEFHLIASYRAPSWAVAVNFGPRFRAEEVPFLSPDVTLGNELVYGVAASARAPWWPQVAAVAELGGVRGDAGVSPAELRVGARYRVDAWWTVGAFFGAGVFGADDVGAPAARGVVDVRFEPRPRLDSDDDGVPDVRDACPKVPEDEDGHADADGCPDLDDDKDGVPDATDACPDVPEDKDRFLDDDGCPEPDNDKDGIPDASDVCPDDADNRCPAAGPDPGGVTLPPASGENHE